MTGRGLELSDTVFRLFADLVRRRTGFVIADAHKPRLESRLAADVRAAGSYYQLYAQWRDLPTAHPAFGRLLDASVNGETYFFRDPDGLAAFAEEIAPERLLIAGADSTLDIWSAGCATGEEPYTLAMLLFDRAVLPARKVRIRATDLSPDAIRRARAGVYSAHALRATPEAERLRYFEPAPAGRFQLRDRVREPVELEVRPLLDEPRDGPLFDVIVCRNVLIYLEEEARKAAADLFASRLKSGGYLLLGPSDALAAAATPLTLIRLQHDVAYRK